MLKCKVKPHDQFKESIKTNRSLFELDPMKFGQSIASNQGIQIDKACNGVASLKPLQGLCMTHTSRCKAPAVQHKVVNESKLNHQMPRATCIDKKIKVSEIDKNEVARKRAYENGKYTKINKSKAVIDHMLCESTLNRRPKLPLSKSSSGRIPYQRENCATINKSYVSDIRKRKREDNISNNSKMINNTAVKKAKLDSTYCYKPIVNHHVSKTIRSISSSNKNRNQEPVFAKNLDVVKRGIPLKSYDKCKMKRNPTAISKTINNFHTHRPSQIPVYKPQSQCNWIECKVNHPIKQSKSKIPLLIHQLGRKNESNLVAHLKRIGAYKSGPNRQNLSSLHGKCGRD